MLSWLRQLDELLRGRKTAPDQLVEGRIALSLRMFIPLAVVLGAIYGFFMGWYALFGANPDRYWQLIASTVKLPALFLLTLLVTFPSLYVFNALIGCRLRFTSTLRLLVGAIAVNVTVAASLGPILGFFTVSTTSYPFMILLNVGLLAIAGVVALSFLLHTLGRLAMWEATGIPPVGPVQIPKPDPAGDTASPAGEPGPLDRLDMLMPPYAERKSWLIFRIWVLIYALVGAQMGWVLRPFIGSPNLQFTWFRPRGGSFFEAVFKHLSALLNTR